MLDNGHSPRVLLFHSEKLAKQGRAMYTSAIPSVGRPRKEDQEFEASLGYGVRSCPQNKYISE
jgi:hypothetical protein